MNWQSILENVIGGVISGLLGLLIAGIVGYFAYRYFTSESVTRLRIYHQILAEKFHVNWRSRDWWRIRTLINRSDVQNALEDPNIAVLQEWLLLRKALIGTGFQPSLISGTELYTSIKSRMRKSKSLREEAKTVGEQIAEANRDPRFGGTPAARQWMEATEQFGIRYPEYYAAVTSNLKLLDEEKRHPEWKTAEFCVAAASISLSRCSGSTTANVIVPENPFVAWTKEQRRHLERSPASEDKWPGKTDMERFCNNEVTEMPPALMRFSAGGSLSILRVLKEGVLIEDGEQQQQYNEEDYTEYVVVGQKDSRAGIHPDYLVPSSGISEEEEDWLNPLLTVVGECVEEIRLRSKDDDSWFSPHFTEECDAAALNERVGTTVESHRRHLMIYEDDAVWNSEIDLRPKETAGTLKLCHAEVLSIGNDTLIINGKEMWDKQLLVLDAEFGAIDIMAAVRIQVPKPLSRLRVLDGEAICDRDKAKMKLLWRNVFVFSPDELFRVFSGQEARVEAFFGRDGGGKWRDGVPVTLAARPWINPPLWGSGPALLKKIYGLEAELFEQNLAQKPRVIF